jgi:uncharacterized membrane protein YqjE
MTLFEKFKAFILVIIAIIIAIVIFKVAMWVTFIVFKIAFYAAIVGVLWAAYYFIFSNPKK